MANRKKAAVVAIVILCGLAAGCVHVPEFSGSYTKITFRLDGTPEMNARFRARLHHAQYRRSGLEMDLRFDLTSKYASDYEASTNGGCEGVSARLEPIIAEAAGDMDEKDAILDAYRRTVNCEDMFLIVD